MNRLPLTAIETFLAIAEQGSMRKAARALGVGPPAVSHQLKAFEDRIGVDLFVRSTRSVTLTEAGKALLDGAAPALKGLSGALEEARNVGAARKGSLRITTPWRAYQLVIRPRLAAFRAAYPAVTLDLSVNEELVDLRDRGFHAGIRLGDRLQDDMIARRLTPPLAECLVAAPSYLETHGIPEHPAALLTHNCILARQIKSGEIAEWRFAGPEGPYSVAVSGDLVFDDLRSVVEAAVDGLGIAWSLRAGVASELAAGRLVALLEDHMLERPGFFLYYPKERKRNALLRLFIDFMTAGTAT